MSGYTCECTNKTFGQNCQFLANFCNLKTPCGPYGVCNGTNETDYTCSCYPGFSGRKYKPLNIFLRCLKYRHIVFLFIK